jgi:two-component system, chemotaxis family, response regulator Rcp1
MSPNQHVTIMIMEDNRADVYLLKQALHKAEMNFTAIVFEDGETALRYIGEAELGKKPIPDLAILDLNVPRRDGSEVLAYIRSTPRLRDVAVIVFSSSTKQVMRDRAAQADCYITKPNELKEFLRIGKEIRACVEAVQAARLLQAQ